MDYTSTGSTPSRRGGHRPWRLAMPTLVLASGVANLATVPAFAAEVPPAVAMVTPMTYRSPAQLADGGVLVVGSSATGVQLADEIDRSGRAVTLSVGEHVRMPRTYRGRDIFWWLDAGGVLDERHDELDDLVRARHVPSPQLIGTPERRSIDLTTLGQLGVEIVGRIGSVRDGVGLFSGGLANTCRLADHKLNRLLERFDGWAGSADIEPLDGPHRPEPTAVPADALLAIDLRRRGIETIVWATGYHPDYTWLELPVLDTVVGSATPAEWCRDHLASTCSAGTWCGRAGRVTSAVLPTIAAPSLTICTVSCTPTASSGRDTGSAESQGRFDGKFATAR